MKIFIKIVILQISPKNDFSQLKNKQKLKFSINIESIDLNKFNKQSQIGKGSFGKVYKVVNKETGEVNAAKISNVKIACLLDSSLAAAISYVKIHGNRFEKESNVLFIEFGDTSMNVFIGKLSKDSVEIKSNLCDESLGGQHFNDLLEKYFLTKSCELFCDDCGSKT